MPLRAPLVSATRLVCSANLRSQAFLRSAPRRLASFTAPITKQGSRRSLLFSALTAATIVAFTSRVYLDSEVSKDKHKFDEDTEVVTDPESSLEFPITIRAPPKINAAPLTIVGVGVRRVSFLGVKVYSVGFYADLNNPNLKIPQGLSPEEKVEHIVRNTACVVRIVPTRNTNFSHLRDAFMRALQSRLTAGIKAGTISEQVAVEAGSPMRSLKSLFPNSPLEKGTPLDILLTPPTPGRPRALIFRDLGAIESDWVATEFVLNYFDSSAPSPALKKAVLENLQNFEK